MQAGESYLGCHIHVNTLVSRRIQPEDGLRSAVESCFLLIDKARAKDKTYI